MKFQKQHLNTIIAALRLYQSYGYGDPTSRPNWLHDIATDMDNDTSLDDEGIDQLIEDLNCGGLPMEGVDPLPTGPTLEQALKNVWDALGAYQDDSIPFEKYQEMADDCDPDDDMCSIYQDTATAYRAEWDELCHHMALIHEALNIPQEDV